MPDISERRIHYVEKELTSAQVKTLVATDVEVVPAPGAGKVAVMLWAALTLKFATTAYAWANTDHGIAIGGAVTDSDAEAQALIESADRHTIVLRPAVDSAEAVENTAIALSASGTGEPATGDSTLVVRCAYVVLDVSESAVV